MIKRTIIMLVSGLLASACELGRELDMQDMGNAPGYFVECYCEPGEMFNLTATRLAPVVEDQLLDYSLAFDTYITAGNRFKLYHSLFMKPGTGFIYNYASNRRLVREDADTLYLDMLAPDGIEISGRTTIPDEVWLDSVSVLNNRVYTSFTTSPDVSQNYYILQIQVFEENQAPERSMQYMQELAANQLIVNREYFDFTAKTDSVVVILKRLTKEGFQYQLSIKSAGDTNKDNLVSPVPLSSNLQGAIGVFTSFTKDRICLKREDFTK